MKHSMKHSMIALALAACAGGGASSSVAWAAPAVPRPGDSLGQEPQKPSPEIENRIPEAPSDKKELRFTLKSIQVDQPESHFPQKDLDAIAVKATGREINVKDLDKMLSELASYGRKHGYPTAYAFVPEQKVKDGKLLVRIALGRYDKIRVEGDCSETERKRAEGLLAGLESGDVIRERSLETALFNVNDLHGLNASGVLVPGEKDGTSDLVVRLERGKRQNITLYTDNYGSVSSGRYRYGLQAGFMNLGNTNGRLIVGGMLSNDQLHNYNVSWDMTLGHSGTNMGISQSRMDYELGDIYRLLDARGVASTTSIYASTPLWHTTSSALSVTYGVDYRDITDEMRAVGVDIKKHSLAAHLGLDGMLRPGKATAVHGNLTVYTGDVKSDSQWGKLMGEAAGTLGRYTKGVLELTALQRLGGSFDLLMNFQGQKASKNLDSSEQIYLGGATGVRAYPSGEGSGDEGYLCSAEFRYHTPLKGLMMRLYYDMGHVRGSKDGLLDGETLKGWGVGLTYQHPDNWFARLDYARRIGSPALLSKDARSHQRIWFLAGKTF